MGASGNPFPLDLELSDVSVNILLPCRVELPENKDKTEGKGPQHDEKDQVLMTFAELQIKLYLKTYLWVFQLH